jgi:hypothetical protein
MFIAAPLSAPLRDFGTALPPILHPARGLRISKPNRSEVPELRKTSDSSVTIEDLPSAGPEGADAVALREARSGSGRTQSFSGPRPIENSPTETVRVSGGTLSGHQAQHRKRQRHRDSRCQRDVNRCSSTPIIR